MILGRLLTNPQAAGAISHAYLWARVFSDSYCRSFKIGQKAFYSQVNDREW